MFRWNAAIQERSIGEGYVALHIAAMRGHKGCVELLLRTGAPPHPRSREGDTPKDLAKENGHYDLAVYLGKHLEIIIQAIFDVIRILQIGIPFPWPLVMIDRAVMDHIIPFGILTGKRNTLLFVHLTIDQNAEFKLLCMQLQQ